MDLTAQLPYFNTSNGFTILIGPYEGRIAGTGTLDSACGHDGGLSFPHLLYFAQFYALVDPATGAFKFATPPGQSDFTGSYELDTSPAGGTVHQSFTYTLHKACTGGGTNC